LEALKAAAAQRLAEGQQVLDLGLHDTGVSGRPLEITSSRASNLWDALCRVYEELGFGRVLDGDERPLAAPGARWTDLRGERALLMPRLSAERQVLEVVGLEVVRRLCDSYITARREFGRPGR
jgi:hypothetical protein